MRKLNYFQIEWHEASRNDFKDTVYGRPEYFDELAAKVTSDAPVFEKRPLVWALRAFEEKWRRIYIKTLRPLSWGARLLYARMWRAYNEGSLKDFRKESYNFLEECEAMDSATRGEFQLLRMSEMAVEDK